MFEIGSALDPGRKRVGKKNQDSLCVIRPTLFDPRSPLLVIADGMGGYEGGAVASQLVVSSFAEVYQKADRKIPPLQALQDGVSAALSAMKQQASQDSTLDRMGSTVVAAVLDGHNIYLLNVGDSRAYLVNDQQVRQLSYDHSLVGEQVRQGIITEADVRYHPRRNVLSMSISAQRQEISSHTGTYEWKSGDCLVLCSDGLWGPVPEPQMQSVVLALPAQQAAERLMALANANQGPDNISVIVARHK